jgi:AP2-associated kinase
MWRLKGLLPKESGGLEGRLIDVGSAKVQVQKTIAQGGFSVVYKCTAAGRTYALKHMIIRDRDIFDLVQKEIHIMTQLRGHPNVVALHSHSFQDTPATGGKECFLLLDYCDNMLVNVMDNLSTKGQFFNEQQVLTVFRDVCNAVYAMHSQSPPIAHR